MSVVVPVCSLVLSVLVSTLSPSGRSRGRRALSSCLGVCAALVAYGSASILSESLALAGEALVASAMIGGLAFLVRNVLVTYGSDDDSGADEEVEGRGFDWRAFGLGFCLTCLVIGLGMVAISSFRG